MANFKFKPLDLSDFFDLTKDFKKVVQYPFFSFLMMMYCFKVFITLKRPVLIAMPMPYMQ